LKCIGPQPLDDAQISDALDGTADGAVLRHLEQCESCRLRYTQAKHIEDSLRHQLYRWDCPSPETLVDYHLGALDPFSARPVKEHVQRCTRCNEEIRSLRDFMGDEQPAHVPFAEGYIRQGEALWASPVQRESELVRGSVSEQPIIHRASDGTQIILDVRERQGRPTLYGQIIDAEGESWQSALVEVRQGETLIAAATVDDLDSFFAPFSSEAPIQLRITRADGKVIILRDLQISADDQ
jgi:hypothetical protein